MTLFDGVFSLNDIFELLTIIGLVYYLVKRFILKEAPLPASALRKIDKEKLTDSLQLLKKNRQKPGKLYVMPTELEERLLLNLHDPLQMKDIRFLIQKSRLL